MIHNSSISTPDFYMQRCLQLASLGAGYVAPNPMVGAVLVYNDRIIGEGYHQKYGEAHAEVNCIATVKEEDKELIKQSVLYVSLEPCAHFGKTPPCADLIIKNKISKVVIGCRDPFKEVDGKGIEKLKRAGINVELGILEKECKEINKRFFTFYTKHRPYIILKWAQSRNKKISSGTDERLLISNEYTNQLVHKWRSEEAGILIGTNTALMDDPELTTRLWSGASPVRLVVDMHLRLPDSLKIFNQQVKTIIFNKTRHEETGSLLYYQLKENVNLAQEIMKPLYQLRIQSVLVEGGARLLQSFIDAQLWDEARVITGDKMAPENGLNAPVLIDSIQTDSVQLYGDTINTFKFSAY